jgi:hypothetical protein
MRTDRRRVSPAQRSLLFEICSSSTRRLHAPEEFLVAFKNALYEEVNALAIPFDGERNDLIADLVSALIEEMFNPAIISAPQPQIVDYDRA